jgi:hypothetical protein
LGSSDSKTTISDVLFWNNTDQPSLHFTLNQNQVIPRSFPEELSLYAGERYWTGNSSALRRYSLRLDGFVSIRAPMAGGNLSPSQSDSMAID